MRLLLDECIPRKLNNSFARHELRPQGIAAVLIRAKFSRLAELLPLVSEILKVLESVTPGQLYKVG